MKKIENLKKYSIGIVLGITMVLATTVYGANNGSIGALFKYSDSNGWKLKGGNIEDNSITSDKIQTGTIVASDISNGTITTQDLNSTIAVFTKTGSNAYYSGKIGIGTDNPTERLEVNGYMKLTGGGPTMKFDDITTDHNGFFIHNNNNKLYFMYDANDDGNWGYQKADGTWVYEIANRIIMVGKDNGISLGVGKDPDVSYSIDAVGTIRATQYNISSDKRLKENINKLNNAISNISKLNGYTYNLKPNGKKDIGLIAQEVEKIFPELVDTDEKGYKSVQYMNLIPVLIEGMKEQQNEIKNLQNDIENMKKEIELIKETLKTK